MPISLIATLGGMYLFDFSINNISLMALTLAVGLVVDDAIVMLENIVRHIEEGMQPFDAALKGSREIGFTIISITVSLIAVFIPVLLMGGVVGRIFHEFAVVVDGGDRGFGLRLADPDADAVRAHAEAAEATGRRAAGIGSTACSKAASTPCSRSMIAGSEILPELPSADADRVSCDRGRHRSGCVSTIPKGFFPQEDIGQLAGLDRGARGHLLRRDGRAAGRRSSECSATRPT